MFLGGLAIEGFEALSVWILLERTVVIMTMTVSEWVIPFLSV
jgi:hypothetical protein